MFFAVLSRNFHHAEVLFICTFVCVIFKQATATVYIYIHISLCCVLYEIKNVTFLVSFSY